MEACPKDINLFTISGELKNIPGVWSIHDLHIWSLTGGKIALTVHIEGTDSHMILTKA
mgnify:CR=1 FL=1